MALKVRISVKVEFEKDVETSPSALGGMLGGVELVLFAGGVGTVGVLQVPLVSELSGEAQEVHWVGAEPAQVAQVVEQGRQDTPLMKNPLEVLQTPQVVPLIW